MARSLASKTNVTPPGGNYPYGRIKDNTGSGDGTPVDEGVYGDIHQFFERLMALTSTTANALPENTANTFQYITALIAFINTYVGSGVGSEAATRAAADTALDNAKVNRSGDTMSGNLAMGGNKVTGLAASTSNGESVRHEQLTVEAATRAADDATEASTRAAADTTLTNNKADKAITISAGTGITGGGDLSANRSLGIANGGVTATQLASDAVTTVKILDANVTTAKILDANVTDVKLASKFIKSADNINYLTKEVSVEDWDMDATTSFSFPHGLPDHDKIVSVSIQIFDDTGTTTIYYLNSRNGSVDTWDNVNINCYRTPSGLFDSTLFDTVPYTRGIAFIIYRA